MLQVVMFWIVDSLLMWKKQLLGDKPPVGVHYHRHGRDPFPHAIHSPRYLRGQQHYHKLCSSDSDTAHNEGAWLPDNNPVYVDSDLSGSGEVHIERTSVPS